MYYYTIQSNSITYVGRVGMFTVWKEEEHRGAEGEGIRTKRIGALLMKASALSNPNAHTHKLKVPISTRAQ